MRREQSRGRIRNIRLAHQAFADEEGMCTCRCEPIDIRMGKDAAFAHREATAWNEWNKALGNFKRGFESFQIAVVDTNQHPT